MLPMCIRRLSGKTSLINIKFAINNLRKYFPESSSESSKYLLQLMQDIILAYNNGMTESEVSSVISKNTSCLSQELSELVGKLDMFCKPSLNQDDEQLERLEKEITRIFKDATGCLPEFNRLPLIARIEKKS